MTFKFEKYRQTAFIFTLIFVFLLIFSLNFFTTYLADDFQYGCGIKSVKDILISQYEHWHSWGGRNVAHFFVQFFMLYDKMLFNFCNSLIYLCFTLLIYFHTVGTKRKIHIHIYIIINLLLWYWLNVWGEVILWLTGSCNYIWTSTICLLFLLPFRFNFTNKINMNYFKSSCMLVIGILSGWSNENTGAAILALLILYATYKKYKNLQFELWEINGIIGFIIGYVLLVIAPGNYVRAEGAFNKSLLDIFLRNIRFCFKRLYISGFPILSFALIASVYHKQIKDNLSKFYLPFVYLFAALVAHFSMVASPEFPPRSTVPVVFFGIIAVCNLLSELDLKLNVVFNRFLICIYFYIAAIDFPIQFYCNYSVAVWIL